MGRLDRGGIVATLLAIACGALASRAAAVPLLRIDGGTGVPGGTAAAVLSLAGDPTGEAVAGSLGIDFPSPPLDAAADDCALADRLAGTHRLMTAAPLPGQLTLTISPLAGTPPLGDGDLATCVFGIALGTPAGTAALTLDATLDDAAGAPIPIEVADGEIIIDVPQPTPTVTNTATITPTPTITLTPTMVPPSQTPTVTPTATRFVPTVLADNLGGCRVTPPGGGALPLLAAAIPLLMRRRR